MKTVKDKYLIHQSYQTRLEIPTQDELLISKTAFSLLKDNYNFKEPIRALSVTAIHLCESCAPMQTILLHDYESDNRRKKLNSALDEIKNTFGKSAIMPAVILDENKMPKNSHKEIVLPGMMHK